MTLEKQLDGDENNKSFMNNEKYDSRVEDVKLPNIKTK